MSRTGENIYKRKDGRWEGRYVKAYDTNGKRINGYVYSKTYQGVKLKLNFAIAESQKRPLQSNGNYIFADLATEWLGRIKMNCKASTYNKYRNTYEKVLFSQLGTYPIAKISPQMIDSLISMLLTSGQKNGNGYSRKSVQEICTVIKQIVNYAEEEYQIKVQFSSKRLQVKQEPFSITVLSKEETQKLRRFLITDTDNYKIGILMCLYTGIRVGELCALQWGDVSLSEGTVTIDKTAQRVQQLGNVEEKTKVIITTPKSACSNRMIPLPQFLCEILRERKLSDENYLLSGNEKCVEPKIMQNCFKKYLAMCGLPRMNFHALRHTFATRCIELGFDAKTLSEILGHSSVNITLNRYVHSSMEQKKKSMRLLDGE